jgi:hypothetical protein
MLTENMATKLLAHWLFTGLIGWSISTYRIFLSARNDSYQYTSDDKDSAPDPELVIAALKHAGDKARSGQKRLNEIVALLPGSPGSSSSSR